MIISKGTTCSLEPAGCRNPADHHNKHVAVLTGHNISKGTACSLEPAGCSNPADHHNKHIAGHTGRTISKGTACSLQACGCSNPAETHHKHVAILNIDDASLMCGSPCHHRVQKKLCRVDTTRCTEMHAEVSHAFFQCCNVRSPHLDKATIHRTIQYNPHQNFAVW